MLKLWKEFFPAPTALPSARPHTHTHTHTRTHLCLPLLGHLLPMWLLFMPGKRSELPSHQHLWCSYVLPFPWIHLTSFQQNPWCSVSPHPPGSPAVPERCHHAARLHTCPLILCPHTSYPEKLSSPMDASETSEKVQWFPFSLSPVRFPAVPGSQFLPLPFPWA